LRDFVDQLLANTFGVSTMIDGACNNSHAIGAACSAHNATDALIAAHRELGAIPKDRHCNRLLHVCITLCVGELLARELTPVLVHVCRHVGPVRAIATFALFWDVLTNLQLQRVTWGTAASVPFVGDFIDAKEHSIGFLGEACIDEVGIPLRDTLDRFEIRGGRTLPKNKRLQ
jgi:hypothetical protein